MTSLVTQSTRQRPTKQKHNITQKTNKLSNTDPTKTRCEPRCSRRVSSFCPLSNTHYVTRIVNTCWTRHKTELHSLTTPLISLLQMGSQEKYNSEVQKFIPTNIGKIRAVTGRKAGNIIAEINRTDGETTIYKIINKTKNRATRNPTKNRD